MSSRDGVSMAIPEGKKVAIVIFTENISGAAYIYDISDIRSEDVELEVDKEIKSIGKGMGSAYCYKFVKRVGNVFFYR